jgi:hypothetical protein
LFLFFNFVGSWTGDHPQEDLVKFGIWGTLQHFGDILCENCTYEPSTPNVVQNPIFDLFYMLKINHYSHKGNDCTCDFVIDNLFTCEWI